MTPGEIRQMFRDSADLRKMGPLDERRGETEKRFAEASAKYRAEYLPAAEPPPAAPSAPDWKAALGYLAGVLAQMDAALPESAKANKAAWAVVAPAVQKFYEGENARGNGGPAK